MKKRIAIILAMTLMFTMLTCTANVAAETVQDGNTLICYENTNAIQPRLTYIASAFATLSLANSSITCGSDFTCYVKGINVNISVSLERATTSNSTNWTSIKSWSKTFTPGYGTNAYGGTLKNPTKGYFYRTSATVLALNSSGKVVEGFTIYSIVKKY